MASSLRGQASKKKQPVENQSKPSDEKLVSTVSEAVDEHSNVSFAVIETEAVSTDETLAVDALDAAQSLETSVETSEEVPVDVSLEKSVEVLNSSVSTKTSKKNSKKKGMENQ
jgi:inosine-uridine nucleoside N-ribohydrolase